MEINKNFNNDEIIEFPDNYEEIANLALLNFEKENKIDLNKLIEKGIEKEQKNINENNFQEDKVNKSEDEWGEFESDEEEKNVNANNYQKFEDDDCTQEEKENNEINTDKNRALDILDNNINICTEIKSIGIYDNHNKIKSIDLTHDHFEPTLNKLLHHHYHTDLFHKEPAHELSDEDIKLVKKIKKGAKKYL